MEFVGHDALFGFCSSVDSNPHADPLEKFLHAIFTNHQKL
jgi:hypothetical protein